MEKQKNIYTWYIWCVICVICVIFPGVEMWSHGNTSSFRFTRILAKIPQLVPKNGIFWSSNFRKIPFLPLFLYIFCTKMTQMTQCHTYINTWRNFIKNLKSRMEKQKKYLYMIYMGVTLWHLWHSRWRKSGTEKIFYIYIYLYIYKFAKIRILWTWYRSILTMYFCRFFIIVYFLTNFYRHLPKNF